MSGPRPVKVEPLHPPKVRSCLRCGTRFRSEGPHNRMCKPCRGRDASPFEPG
jgi:tRNA(Ile2) C34 agmatinyltransferase TiaS